MMVSPFSSFDGLIPEIPGIAVDNFEQPDCIAYFLSHCHTDHTQGLSNEALRRHLEDNDVSIYMSDVTAAIIGAIPCYDGIRKYVKTLMLGSTKTIKLSSIYDDILLDVTLIPAGHCFGSVMFLFRTTYSTILFTGDFRISANDVSKLGQLHDKNKEPILIDKMYVDTTFLDCIYEHFPKRSETIEYITSVIKDWLDRSPNNAVALHPSARFGYEYIFIEIYKRMNIKVFVQEQDWSVYSNFSEEKVSGVTNQLTRIHKCRNRSEKNHHQTTCNLPDNINYLFIHMSAMKWSEYNSETLPFNRLSENRVDVCIATHCSRSELIHFVSYYSPKKVVGFPNRYEVESQRGFQIEFRPPKRKISDRKAGGKKMQR